MFIPSVLSFLFTTAHSLSLSNYLSAFSYESFIKRTQFGDNSPDFIKVEYFTDCAGQFPSLRKRNYCNNVSQGKEIEFFVDVTLTDYPENGVLVEY